VSTPPEANVAADAEPERSSRLLVAARRLRADPEFAWVLDGLPSDWLAEGNSQPPRDAGLWYSPTRARDVVLPARVELHAPRSESEP
jgi:hypothetical protein